MMFYIFLRTKKGRRRIEKIRQAFHHRTMCLLMKMHLISLVAAAKQHRAKKWIPNYQISESWACCSLRAKKVRAFFCTFLHGWSGNSVVDCDWLRSRNLLHSICSLLAKLDKKTLMDSLKSLVINRYEPKNARLGLKWIRVFVPQKIGHRVHLYRLKPSPVNILKLIAKFLRHWYQKGKNCVENRWKTCPFFAPFISLRLWESKLCSHLFSLISWFNKVY